MQERPSASINLIACGIVSGYSPPCSMVSKAQAGAVHVQVLRTLIRRHLCKFVGEFHHKSSSCSPFSRLVAAFSYSGPILFNVRQRTFVRQYFAEIAVLDPCAAKLTPIAVMHFHFPVATYSTPNVIAALGFKSRGPARKPRRSGIHHAARLCRADAIRRPAQLV
jgi:hypothetical protein